MTEQASNIVQVPQKFTTVWNSQKPYQIWYGGRGSAKSWTKAIYFLAKSMTSRYNRTVFARDTQKNVRLSQYQLFKDVAKRFSIFEDKFDFHDTTMKITCKQNGNFLIGGSFEQPDSLRSVADPTDFWAEEPITRSSQINRQDFFDIVGSLRNSEGIQTMFHFTFNPISKESWIFKDFFEQDLYDCEKLFVNYPDNPFCPQTTIDFLESLKTLDEKRYSVDALGNWGVILDGLVYPDYEICDDFSDYQFIGVDWGFTNPTSMIAGKIVDNFESEKKDYFVKELLYKPKLDANDLVNEFNRLGIDKRTPIIADSARPELIAAIKKAGYKISGADKPKGSVVSGINEVKKYNLKIAKGSANVLSEVQNYQWRTDKNDAFIDEPIDDFNHAMDALRYGLQAIDRPKMRMGRWSM